MILLIALSFFVDSVRVDSTSADTLTFKSAYIECRMQKARINSKLDSILVQLKKEAVLKKIKGKKK